jgi:heme-degrading monooxygenase HmoA
MKINILEQTVVRMATSLACPDFLSGVTHLYRKFFIEQNMITEIALLNIRRGESANFEIEFGEAQKIISSMNGYIEHELQKCVEADDKYLLIVRWRNLEDHAEGFRKALNTTNGKNYCIIFMILFLW